MTTLYSQSAISVVPPVDATVAPKKRGWLPLLTVLFLLSYGLMTMLIVEQGQTIESQRALIRELFRDSKELTDIKLATQQAKNKAAMQEPTTQAPVTQSPSIQAPSTQIPSTQAPMTQAPSSQTHRGAQNQSEKQTPHFQVPSKPGQDLVDERRMLHTI